MAGLGYKDFVDGEILSAAQVDGYLNQQTVMVFASAAARTTALSAVLSEGMHSYLLDTNCQEVYNGTAWVPSLQDTLIAATSKTTPVDADVLPLSDSAASNGLKKLTWANLKATLVTYFDTLYQATGLSILKSLLTTTGDIIYASGASVAARLGIGTTGQVLTVAGGLPSWATPAGGGGRTLIEEKVLAAAVSSISFAFIPGTYKSLYLEFTTRLSDAATDATLILRINSDAGANYDMERFYAVGASAGASSILAGSNVTLGQNATANNAPASAAFSGDVLIPHYARTVFHKNILTRGFGVYDLGAGGAYTENTRARWRNTAAITTLDVIDASGGNLMIGSVFTLWGES